MSKSSTPSTSTPTSAHQSGSSSPVKSSPVESALPQTYEECRSLNQLVELEMRLNGLNVDEAEKVVVLHLAERYKPTATPPKAKQPRGKQGQQKPSAPATAGNNQKRTPAAQQPRQGKNTPASSAPVPKPKQPNTVAAPVQQPAQPKKEPKLKSLLANHPAQTSKFDRTQKTIWRGVVARFETDHPITVAPGPHDQLTKIKDLGLDYRDPVGTYNAHTLGASVRAALRRRALLNAVMDGHVHLAEFFGNEQTHQFISILNVHLKAHGWNSEIKIDAIGEHRSVKDLVKRSGESTTTMATFGLMIDIYDHNCVETSENLAEYMRAHASRMERLYVIHNVMCGHAGTAPGYIWYAPSIETRLVQIGDSAPFEHKYFDWMDVTSHSPCAGWYEDRSYSLSDTVKMVGTIFVPEGSLDPVPNTKPLKTRYQYFGVPQSKIAQLRNWIKGEQPMILLDKKMMDQTMARFSNKNQTEFVYSSIKNHVAQLLRDEGWVKLSNLIDYDNDYVACVMTDLVMHKTYHQNRSSYAALNPFVTKFQSVSMNAMFTPQTAPRMNATIERWLKVGGATAAAILVFLYLRRRVLLKALKTVALGAILPVDQMFGDIVISPIVEEMMKRVVPHNAFTLFLACYETYRDRARCPPLMLAARFAMHIVTALLPYGYGVVAHAAWNIYAYSRVLPEIFSLSSWLETAEHQERMQSERVAAGALLNVATVISLYNFLTRPRTDYCEYQNALIHDPAILDYAHGTQSLTCPEFTTCPPATFSDNQIQIADDRVVKVHDVEMSDWNEVIEMFHNCYDPSVHTKIYHVITFNGPSMWAPQPLKNSLYAALCLAYGRIGKMMCIAPHSHCWRFDELPQIYKNSFAIFDCAKGSYKLWLSHWRAHVIISGKWHKYEQFWSDANNIDEHDFRVQRSLQRIQIMSKSDEVLLGKDISKLLPRPIDNIAPIVSFLTGPLDFMLKYALLDGRTPSNLDSYSFPYKLPGLETIDLAFDFFWVPALGFTQHDLTAVMQQFCHRDNAALLLSHGDDTLLVYISEGRILMMESDLSACDRSLTKPALTFERDIIDYCLQLAGCEDRFFASNRVAYKLNFADRKINEVTVSLDGDAQRPTGCTRTSLMNTVLTAFPILLYHLEHKNANCFRLLETHPEQFSAYYRVHGLDAKVKLHQGSVNNFPTGTFLKGVWLHSDCGELAWTRLPSMALKMFKTLKPLPVLTKRFRTEKVSLDDARRRYCVMLATSWVSFDLPHGIRQWVDKWANVDPTLPSLVLDGRVCSGELSLYSFSNARALTSLSEHYGVDVDLFVDWCDRFANLEPGEGYVHPMWPVLSRDY